MANTHALSGARDLARPPRFDEKRDDAAQAGSVGNKELAEAVVTIPHGWCHIEKAGKPRKEHDWEKTKEIEPHHDAECYQEGECIGKDDRTEDLPWAGLPLLDHARAADRRAGVRPRQVVEVVIHDIRGKVDQKSPEEDEEEEKRTAVPCHDPAYDDRNYCRHKKGRPAGLYPGL